MQVRLLLFIVVVCLSLGACSPAQNNQVDAANQLMETISHPSKVELHKLPEVTVDIIRDAYDYDQLAADKLYGGKWLKVRGNLFYGPTSEGYQGLNVQYVGLEHNNRVMAFIFMGQKQSEALGKLRKGQTLVIAGNYVPGEKHHPKLLGCVLLAVE